MRISVKEKNKKIAINDPKKVSDLLIDILKMEEKSDRMKEHFWGIYLNARNMIVRIELIHLGSVDASIVHPREIFRPAIVSFAVRVIVAHNHPSGDVQASGEDREITDKLKESGKILGVEICDHLIINEKGEYFSLNKKGGD